MQQPPIYMTIPSSQVAQLSKIPVQILPDKETLFHHMARAIADEIKTNNEARRPTRLILPVGPVGQYPLLVQICNRERISWKNVFTFNMDEYCDWQGRAIPSDHPLSFRGFMHKMLFDRLDPELSIPPEQVHFPDPLSLDEISREIEAAGGIDTCYGGIGYHGHIAFNEPPVSRWYTISPEEFKRSLTRVVPVAPDTVVMNSIRNTGGNPAVFPPMGVTLGMGDILASRRLRMYCPGGAWQRAVVRIAMFSEEDVAYPATLLQGHPDYQLVIDEETAQPPTISLF